MGVNKQQTTGLVPRLRFPEFRRTGDWSQKFGSEVFTQISNKDHNSDLPVLAVTQDQGAVPRETIDYHVSVTEKSLESYKVVEIGDFIISLRSFQGGIEFSKYWGICSPAYIILRLTRDYAQDYFRYYLKTDRFISQMTKNLEGLRDGKMISYKQFSELKLPIPPLPEQQKIADCLSSLDDLITAENQKLDALKTHKQGLMQQLFPREGETVPRLRFPEFRGAGEWKVEPLGSIAEITSGGTPNRAKSSYWNGPIPWITTSLIDFNRIDGADEFITAEGLKNSSAKLFTPGTLLMAMYGQGKTRGKVSLLGINATTNQACAAIILSGDIDANFTFQNLASRYEEIRKLSNEGNQKNLSAGLIKKILLTYPCLAEQQKIANCLSSLDDLITAQTKKIDALKTHKKGLMQQLFPSLEVMEI